MTTLDDVLRRLATLGLPVAFREFKDTKKNPAPEPPFAVYLAQERQRGSDDKNRLREVSASIELYTDRAPDAALEKRIEEEVLFDVEFDKYQAEIKTENVVQTAYDFEILQKKGI